MRQGAPAIARGATLEAEGAIAYSKGNGSEWRLMLAGGRGCPEISGESVEAGGDATAAGERAAVDGEHTAGLDEAPVVKGERTGACGEASVVGRFVTPAFAYTTEEVAE